MPTYFVNSILVTGASIVLILVLGTMAGYAVARYEFAHQHLHPAVLPRRADAAA